MDPVPGRRADPTLHVHGVQTRASKKRRALLDQAAAEHTIYMKRTLALKHRVKMRWLCDVVVYLLKVLAYTLWGGISSSVPLSFPKAAGFQR